MKTFIKENIINLKPYIHWKIYNDTFIKLNANESNYEIPFNFKDDYINFLSLNCVSKYHILDEAKVSILFEKWIWFNSSNIIIDNGSSQLLKLIMTSVLSLNDTVLTFSPTFLLYKTISDTIWSKLAQLPLIDNKFIPLQREITKINPKLIILCNPNNPTWFLLDKKNVEDLIINNSNSFILLDEAYIEFWWESLIELVKKYDNLIITRTFSKAFSLAWVRLWFAISNSETIWLLKKVQLPYNLNIFTLFILYNILENINKYDNIIKNIISLRNEIKLWLEKLWLFVEESNTNFLFFKIDNALFITNELEKEKILVRNFWNKWLKSYIRVTIWTKKEMKIFLKEFKDILNNN